MWTRLGSYRRIDLSRTFEGGSYPPALYTSTLSFSSNANDLYRNRRFKNFNNEFITWLAHTFKKYVGGPLISHHLNLVMVLHNNLFEEQPLIGKIQQEIKKPVTMRAL